jgi:hypothetical protein
MKFRSYAVVIVLILCALAGAAFAQPTDVPAAEAPALQQLTGHVIEIVAAVLALLATWLTTKVGGWLQRKTGVETDVLLDSLAAKAVNFAKEQAHKFLQEKGEKMRGPEKLELAMKFGLDLVESHGLPKAAQDKLVNYIESKLGEARDA